MLLCLTATDENQGKRQFSCLLDELEVVFNFLNHLVVAGHTLTGVRIIEKGQSRTLPIEAFDGVSLALVFEQLELEWSAALSESPRLSVSTDQTQVRWRREQLAFYEQRIIQLELMITDVNRLYRRAEYTLKPGRKPSGNPYQSVLIRYEFQLNQVHQLRKELLVLL